MEKVEKNVYLLLVFVAIVASINAGFYILSVLFSSFALLLFSLNTKK